MEVCDSSRRKSNRLGRRMCLSIGRKDWPSCRQDVKLSPVCLYAGGLEPWVLASDAVSVPKLAKLLFVPWKYFSKRVEDRNGDAVWCWGSKASRVKKDEVFGKSTFCGCYADARLGYLASKSGLK